MSKGKKDARQAARELAAAQRRAEQRRKRLIAAGSAVGVVVLADRDPGRRQADRAGQEEHPVASSTAATSLVNGVTGVPPATLDQVGKGSVDTLPQATSGQAVLKGSDGKPIVFYMGAEYCPYCAAERWPMIVALSRFGTFQNLSTTSSSSTDTFPNTPTFTFHGATYTSQYIDFQPKEIQSDNGVPLETLTADQQKLVDQFDPPPAGQTGNSFPFLGFRQPVDRGRCELQPAVLAGMTQQQVADAVEGPEQRRGQGDPRHGQRVHG